MKRAITATVVVVAATLLLAGCSAAGGGSGSADSAPAPAAGRAPDSETGDGTAGSAADGLGDRAVVTTGTLSLTALDPVGAAAETVDIVTSAGGRIDSRSERPATDDRTASASLVLRIPSDRFEAVVDGLRGLGRVDDFSTDALDVTQQRQDVDARITALRTSAERITALMAGAASTAEIIEMENALSERQSELDSLVAQRDSLDDRIAYSALSVQVSAPGVAPSSPDSFGDGLAAGWDALVGFFAVTLIVLGVFLPWLALFGAIAIAVVVIVRMSRHRRTPAATPSTAPPAAEREHEPVTSGEPRA